MTDAPEKIWATPITDNYGEWQTSPNGLPRPTEYTRSDLVSALAAESERLKVDVGECRLVIEQQDRHAEAHSRTGAVKVKPLEWTAHKGDQECKSGWTAHGFAGWYAVEERHEGHFDMWTPNNPDGGRFQTVEEAKAAAQSDYERRILSALAPHPRDTNTVEDHETGNVRDKLPLEHNPTNDQIAAVMAREIIAQQVRGGNVDRVSLEVSDSVITALTAASFRILGPGEVDPVTVEKAMEVATEAYASAAAWDYFNSAEFSIAAAIRSIGRKP